MFNIISNDVVKDRKPYNNQHNNIKNNVKLYILLEEIEEDNLGGGYISVKVQESCNTSDNQLYNEKGNFYIENDKLFDLNFTKKSLT